MVIDTNEELKKTIVDLYNSYASVTNLFIEYDISNSTNYN